MDKTIYFETIDGSIVTDVEIARSYYIFTGKRVSLNQISKIAETECNGVIREVEADYKLLEQCIRKNQIFLAKKYFMRLIQLLVLKKIENTSELLKKNLKKRINVL